MSITVIEAKFGVLDGTNDVLCTSSIQSRIDTKNTFYVGSYMTGSADPAPGKKKQLNIVFEYNGKQYTQKYNESIQISYNILLSATNIKPQLTSMASTSFSIASTSTSMASTSTKDAEVYVCHACGYEYDPDDPDCYCN